MHFSRVYRKNLWGGVESLSGPGSTLRATASLCPQLIDLFRELGVRTLVDAGCGDFNWLSHADLNQIQYIGLDVVPQVIDSLRQRYKTPTRHFLLHDITKSIPMGDLALCRHAMQHLPNRDVLRFLKAVRRSQTRYLLMTTYPTVAENIDTYRGGFRRNNMQKSPFDLPPPLRMLDDGVGPLGLWSREQLDAYK